VQLASSDLISDDVAQTEHFVKATYTTESITNQNIQEHFSSIAQQW
jgi:hypothetical protein